MNKKNYVPYSSALQSKYCWIDLAFLFYWILSIKVFLKIIFLEQVLLFIC